MLEVAELSLDALVSLLLLHLVLHALPRGVKWLGHRLRGLQYHVGRLDCRGQSADLRTLNECCIIEVLSLSRNIPKPALTHILLAHNHPRILLDSRFGLGWEAGVLFLNDVLLDPAELVSLLIEVLQFLFRLVLGRNLVRRELVCSTHLELVRRPLVLLSV